MPYNQECVCGDDITEGGDDLCLLKCCHVLHDACLSQLIKAECPYCNYNFSKECNASILAKIHRNAVVNADALLTQYTREQEKINSREENLPVDFEILLAYALIRDLEIPLWVIPKVTSIEIDGTSPLPPRGVIFETMLGELASAVLKTFPPPDSESNANSANANSANASYSEFSYDPELDPEYTSKRQLLVYKDGICKTITYTLKDIPKYDPEIFHSN